MEILAVGRPRVYCLFKLDKQRELTIYGGCTPNGQGLYA